MGSIALMELPMRNTCLIHVSKINNLETLRDALKHNLRLIPRETSIPSHIDPARSSQNQVLEGGLDPIQITREVGSRIKEETKKPLRKNGVVAIEVVFSLPYDTVVENPCKFFAESKDWLAHFWGCPVISAVIHLDERNPHIHVLVLPLKYGRMTGSAIVGFKPELNLLKREHHREVGSQHGLTLIESVPRFKRHAAALEILKLLQQHPDWITHPSISTALLGAFAARPGELMSVLGIEPKFG